MKLREIGNSEAIARGMKVADFFRERTIESFLLCSTFRKTETVGTPKNEHRSEKHRSYKSAAAEARILCASARAEKSTGEAEDGEHYAEDRRGVF